MFLLHFSQFKTFLFCGHSKIKVCSCVLCVYAGTPLASYLAFPDTEKFCCLPITSSLDLDQAQDQACHFIWPKLFAKVIRRQLIKGRGVDSDSIQIATCSFGTCLKKHFKVIINKVECSQIELS